MNRWSSPAKNSIDPQVHPEPVSVIDYFLYKSMKASSHMSMLSCLTNLTASHCETVDQTADKSWLRKFGW
jgi:hypothetical protein